MALTTPANPPVDLSLTSSIVQSLSPEAVISLYYNWEFWARAGKFKSPNEWTGQLEPPGTWWNTWFMKPGRGWGKTRVLSEYARKYGPIIPKLNIVAPTTDDAREVNVLGESGIMAVCPKAERPTYVKNEHKLIWPNGNESLLFTGMEPERLRGKQHGTLIIDELAAMRYGKEVLRQAKLGLRLPGAPCRLIIASTPRPIQIIKDLISDPLCVHTNGGTRDNAANLSARFINEIITQFAGTRLERQEINGEILSDIPGALWTYERLDRNRIDPSQVPRLTRIVVAVDPPGTEPEDDENPEPDKATECGIVCCGMDDQDPPHGYCFEDVSLVASPDGWASEAVSLYHRRRADRLVGEKNFGGKMVEHTIRSVDRDVSYSDVWASDGKRKRAEPIASRDEQGRMHMVGSFPKLEDEMTTYTGRKIRGQKPEKSPNRLDAYVWAMTELFGEEIGYVSEGYVWGEK